MDPHQQSQSEKLPFLTSENTDFVNEKGEKVILKGCNLGSWLNLEMWMMDIKDDQQKFLKGFNEDRLQKPMRMYDPMLRTHTLVGRDFVTFCEMCAVRSNILCTNLSS